MCTCLPACAVYTYVRTVYNSCTRSNALNMPTYNILGIMPRIISWDISYKCMTSALATPTVLLYCVIQGRRHILESGRLEGILCILVTTPTNIEHV